MPIKVNPSETQDEFIGRCMSEEASSFPDEQQRYAVCIGYWQEERMSRVKELKSFMKK